MKIGRNDSCPCGSGKKFKKCCLDKQVPPDRRGLNSASPELIQRAQEMLRLHEAEERVRRQQQGHGSPIISVVHQGFRFVAVRGTLYWNKNWLVFPDFLLAFLKKSFGEDWGEREKPLGLHPIFRWLEKFQHYSDSHSADGKLKSAPMIGFISCWLHLGYALYLIAHNDEIPELLLKRLRNIVTFMPAYYEATVGAALAVAGFKLSCAETKATSKPTPEFRATSKASGSVYEVEAKRKNRWKEPTVDVSSEEFQRELESYVRDQIHAASKKMLKNPIYWIELSIPTMTKETEWRVVTAKIVGVLRDAEKNMTVAGEPIQPAFVVFTNHTYLANEDIEGEPSFALLETINIDDYPFGRVVEIEAALESYDKYRDIFWMMEAWKIAKTVPTTFDGTPPELLSANGDPQRTIRLGDIVDTEDFEGKPVKAKVTEIASMDDHAMVALTANGRNWLAKMPLTPGEAAAAKRYSDAIFGKDNASRKLREDDPFDLYDFFLRAHENMTQEQCNKLLKQTPMFQQYKCLPLKELRIRVAREYTKIMWAKKHEKK